ncbi:MbtH family protein [Kitasatospora sp. NPDC036755]|uniref:MbtH family protein n=1 Tax=Kitasatospora sp. NPDC036755 TaxID=3154600 RepID=UPI0033BFDFEA
MSNPFEDPDGRFLVLVDDEGRHSLWPAALPAPAGWRTAHPEDDRQSCLDYVEQHWTDLRPRSLAGAIDPRTES